MNIEISQEHEPTTGNGNNKANSRGKVASLRGKTRTKHRWTWWKTAYLVLSLLLMASIGVLVYTGNQGWAELEAMLDFALGRGQSDWVDPRAAGSTPMGASTVGTATGGGQPAGSDDDGADPLAEQPVQRPGVATAGTTPEAEGGGRPAVRTPLEDAQLAELRTLDFTRLGAPAVEAFGTVQAPNVINISVQLPFRVQSVLVQSGQVVRRGQSLVRMDLAPYREQLERSELGLRAAEIRYESLQRSFTRTDLAFQREIESLRASIALAEQELLTVEAGIERMRGALNSGDDSDLRRLDNDIARVDDELERSRETLSQSRILFNEGALSQQRLSDAEAAVRTIESQRTNLSIARQTAVDTKTQQIRDSELNAQQRRTTIDNLRRQLSQRFAPEFTDAEIQEISVQTQRAELAALRSRLNRPFVSGEFLVSHLNRAVVADLVVREEDMVGAGMRILSLVDTSRLVVEANIPEALYRDIRIGDPARFVPLSDRSREYRGRVTAIAGIAETRNDATVVPVTFSIEDVDSFLLPNFNLDVQVFAAPAQ